MKRGTPEHPKVFELCDALRVRRPAVVGYLELLWHFTARYAPQGDVGRFSDQRIEAALDWAGKAGKLVDALISTGWLDRHPESRLLVHDWHDHADDAIRKRLTRSNLQFLTLADEPTGQSTVTDRKVSATQSESVCLPEPVPEPVPEPLPPPVSVREIRRAKTSRFDEWMEGYRGRKADPDYAIRAWISANADLHADVAFACRDRYNDSAEVERGALMEAGKFIFQQSGCGWGGSWPKARTATEQPRSIYKRTALDANGNIIEVR